MAILKIVCICLSRYRTSPKTFIPLCLFLSDPCPHSQLLCSLFLCIEGTLKGSPRGIFVCMWAAASADRIGCWTLSLSTLFLKTDSLNLKISILIKVTLKIDSTSYFFLIVYSEIISHQVAHDHFKFNP